MIRRSVAPLAAVCFVAAFAAPAFADKAAGDACAAGLSADGKAIYAAVGATSGDLRSVVTDTTKSLVMSGKIDRGNARTNAQAAGACLEQARS